MKNSQLLNYLLLKKVEIISTEKSNILDSNEFKNKIKQSKLFRIKKSGDNLELDWVWSWSTMKAFASLIIYLEQVDTNKIKSCIKFPQYFLLLYLIANGIVVVMFLIDLVTETEIAGGISKFIFIPFIFPIFTYLALLFNFVLIEDSCKRDIKLLLSQRD